MKAETYKDYRSRVGRCVRVLESSPDEPVTLAALARTACLSKFHFIRVFAELAGESPISMARRLRLEAAHRRLQKERALSVGAAAGHAGFLSQQAFSRRFSRHFGLVPSKTRSRRMSPSETAPYPIHLASRRIIRVPFDGRYRDLSAAFGGLLGAVNGLMKEPSFDVMFASDTCFDTRPDDPCWGQMLISADTADLATMGLPCGWSTEGWFMVFPGRGSFNERAGNLSRSIDRAIQSIGRRQRPGSVIRRFLNDPALVPISDQSWEIYVPINHP